MKKCLTLCVVLLLAAHFLHAKSKPDTVKVGAFIISVHDINFHDQQFTVRFWLWFNYSNPKLDFAKQIDIPNAKDIEISSESVDTVNGKYWAQMRVKCTMKENWRVQDFPFDEQHLKIEIEDEEQDINSVVFVADKGNSRFDSIEALEGWRVDKFKVSTDKSIYKTSFGNPDPGHHIQTFSMFTIEMDIAREATGLFLKVFLGMYFAFLIALVSFLSDTNELEPRFGLPVGGLFAAVGNKYIIDSLLPQSSQFSLVDILHSLTFLGIFGILTVSAIALKLHNHDQVTKAHRVNKIGAAIVIVGYIVTNVYYIVTS
ncbi:MAG: hypothetical protein JST69_03330 [Bacteroidetes bacterium]|nr:hypothetical protein [Bacteroidota bacterium]